MSFDGRISRLEREIGYARQGGTVSFVMIVDDVTEPVNRRELATFLEQITRGYDAELRIFHGSDNGRGDRGAHLFYGWREATGRPFVEQGPLIRCGHLVASENSRP